MTAAQCSRVTIDIDTAIELAEMLRMFVDWCDYSPSQLSCALASYTEYRYCLSEMVADATRLAGLLEEAKP